MAVFLLECKEDKEGQTDYPSKEMSQSNLEMTASFANDAILMEIKW